MQVNTPHDQLAVWLPMPDMAGLSLLDVGPYFIYHEIGAARTGWIKAILRVDAAFRLSIEILLADLLHSCSPLNRRIPPPTPLAINQRGNKHKLAGFFQSMWLTRGFLYFWGEEYAVIYPILQLEGEKKPSLPSHPHQSGQPEGVQCGDHHPARSKVGRDYLIAKLGGNIWFLERYRLLFPKL